MQDFPSMVTRNGMDLRGYFDNERKAQVDPDHCVRLNYEAYFFADPVSVDRFLSDPIAYCGLLTDPVSKRRFRPAPGAKSASFEDIEYYFENETNRAMFVKMPESYRLPGYKMKPMEPDAEATSEDETVVGEGRDG